MSEITDDELEIRAIEDQLYQIVERWTRLRFNETVSFDCGMLTAARTILDGFLGGDAERDLWMRERDEKRSNDRLGWALERSNAAHTPPSTGAGETT